MNCLECNKKLSHLEHKKSIDLLGIELCKQHISRIEKLIEKNGTSIEAVQLYYSLKAAGVNAMLEWWDGKKSVDIAISRVKLNIEIDNQNHKLSHEQALKYLEEAMHSFKNGFTTIRIPHVLIKHSLKETVNNILGIIEGLRDNIKVI